MTSLSIVPPLQHDETITSWIIRLSAANHYPIIDILHKLGLAENDSWRAVKGGHDIFLTPREAANISQATKVPVDIIQAHTINEHYSSTGIITPLSDRSHLRAWAISNPVWASKSMYCPLCLKENQAWKMEWKLPFTYLCAEHNIILTPWCPECQWGSPEHNRDGNARFFNTSSIGAPGHCQAPRKPGTATIGRYATPCNHNLMHASTRKTSPRIVTTQHVINETITVGHDSEWWNDLHILNGLVHNYAPVSFIKKYHPAAPLPKKFLTHWNTHLNYIIDRYENGKRLSNITYPYDPVINTITLPIAHNALTNTTLLHDLTNLPKLHVRQTSPHTRISTANPSRNLTQHFPWMRKTI